MKQEFRQSPWRAVAGLAAAYVAIAGGIVACAPDHTRAHVPAQSAPLGAAGAPTITNPRLCAAVAVYSLATGDHWDQRAVIARASFNRFNTLGHVPDCGSALFAIAAAGLDTLHWQAALDAADAVQSGSYAIPHACARVDTVVSPPARTTVEPTGHPPLAASAARAQCVLGGLAFVEGGAL